jgi:MinD superfamily P-loop ATPase
MKESDFVLLVTEPTPFGLHDLKLAVGAVEILQIPSGLVINRSDLGDDAVKKFARQKGLPILMEIPFDRQIAAAYSKGEMLVDVMPQWKEKFLELHDKIRHLSKNQTLNTKHQTLNTKH